MRIDRLSKGDTKDFFNSVLALEDIDECYAFFDDLMTLKEMKVFVTRLVVANMLLEGRTYQEIEAKTQASTAIISRVKRSIEEGNGSYEIVKKRLISY